MPNNQEHIDESVSIHTEQDSTKKYYISYLNSPNHDFILLNYRKDNGPIWVVDSYGFYANVERVKVEQDLFSTFVNTSYKMLAIPVLYLDFLTGLINFQGLARNDQFLVANQGGLDLILTGGLFFE